MHLYYHGIVWYGIWYAVVNHSMVCNVHVHILHAILQVIAYGLVVQEH